MSTTENELIVGTLAGGSAFVRAALASVCRRRYPDDLEIDHNGYPNDDRVEEIASIADFDAARWMLDVLVGQWEAIGGYGTCIVSRELDEHANVDPSAPVRVTLTTGGWSGCESVVWAVLEHPKMASFLVEEVSGGKYVFEIPSSAR